VIVTIVPCRKMRSQFSRPWGFGKRSAVLTFRHTFGALLAATLGALAVVACLLALDNDDLGLFASFVLLGYFLVVCYIAELLFVAPGLVLSARLRQPGFVTAAVYGMFVGWSVPLMRSFLDGKLMGWRTFGPAAMAGAASGLIYVALVRRVPMGATERAPSVRVPGEDKLKA
jgi:hypothetical protein